jgi:hypothetical protein
LQRFFLKELSELKSGFSFIYPVDEDSDNLDIEDEDVSLFGLSEREQFLQDYGAYMEMVYILTGGNLLLDNQVYSLPATEFLFKSEYLLRKRKIENIKSPTKES